MAKNCILEKSVLRQRQIENGLLELMQKDSYEDISIASLCRYLDLPYRTFFRYFEDKKDLLDSMLNHIFQDFAAMGAVNESDFIRQFTFWYENRKVLDALCKSNLQYKLYDYCLAYMNSTEAEQLLTAEMKELNALNEVCLFTASVFASMVIAWHADGFKKTPKQVAHIYYYMVTTPLFRPM